MYRSFIYILLIFVVITTIALCLMKPKMHDSVLIYNFDYQLQETMVAEAKTIKKDEVRKESEPEKIIQKKTVKEKRVKVQPTEKKSVIVKKKNEIKERVVTKQDKVLASQNPLKQEIKEEKTVITEEIEWNKWRSNIQNRIMQDVKLPVLPNGTIFKFSFDVDKYGKVSNVRAWSMTPDYTPYAVQYIAPVIRSYQGHSLLDFPSGSQRVATVVTGQWKISSSQKYSTSSNFHDIESIQKGNQ